MSFFLILYLYTRVGLTPHVFLFSMRETFRMPNPEMESQFNKPELAPRDLYLEKFFGELKDFTEANSEANEWMIEFATAEPKIRDILRTPQSPDKHAEGPTVEDHYRSILSSFALLRDGKIPYARAKEILGLEDAASEWGEVEQVAREHPNLLIAFAFLHDVAKPDTIGFVARDGSPAIEHGFPTKAMDKENEKRKKKAKEAAKKGDPSLQDAFDQEQEARRAERSATYERLFAEFSSSRQGADPMNLQKEFFDAYGISISYRGHAEQAYQGTNLEVVQRTQDRLNLTDEERLLLRFAIEQHINPLIKFERVEGKDVHSFVEAANALGIDPQKAIRVLQTGMLVDGIIGTLKLPTVEKQVGEQQVQTTDTSGEPYLYSAPLVNFWKAQRLYEESRQEEDEKRKEEEAARLLKTVLKEEGLDGEALKALGINQGPEMGKMLGMISWAMRGEGNLPHIEDDQLRSTLETRVKRANARLRQVTTSSQ
jgi:hypothetical protein